MRGLQKSHSKFLAQRVMLRNEIDDVSAKQ